MIAHRTPALWCSRVILVLTNEPSVPAACQGNRIDPREWLAVPVRSRAQSSNAGLHFSHPYYFNSILGACIIVVTLASLR
jgi:hypothetical protein